MGEIDKLIGKVNPKYKKGPIWQHTMRYDTDVGMLEPIYYWILDFLGKYDQEKLVDNFTTTPGSSYFADLGQRATRMQEEGLKIMGMVNTVIKSIINLVYDLKDFDLRLAKYEEYHSKNPQKRTQGLLGLKEIWMNKVDSQRGMGAINNMAHQYGFTLLRPSFMAASSPESVDDMDINNIVRNVLKPRVSEFFTWIDLSERELKQRYQVQKAYLKNQVDTLKLYSQWVTPYLKAAEQLRMKERKTEPSLVSVFTSMIMELSVLGTAKVDVVGEAHNKNLPPYFAKISKKMRDVYEIVIVDFTFRTYPTQQAPHSGRIQMDFRAYALNDDELKLLKKLKENEDLNTLLGTSERLAESTLKEMVEDIEKYTTDKDVEEEKKKKEEEEQGMFEGLFKEITQKFTGKTREETIAEEEKAEADKKKDEKEHLEKLEKYGVPEDSYEEGLVRDLAEATAAEMAFKAYDIFKKSRGMASFPSPFDSPDVYKRLRAKRAEIASMLKK